eukprot:Nk52_evm1s2507 gene=Nk52_evmTU1s2507
MSISTSAPSTTASTSNKTLVSSTPRRGVPKSGRGWKKLAVKRVPVRALFGNAFIGNHNSKNSKNKNKTIKGGIESTKEKENSGEEEGIHAVVLEGVSKGACLRGAGRKSWEGKMKQRADQRAVREMEAEWRERVQREREEKRRRREEKKERREANSKKSEVVQVITNSRKIKKMSRKQLKQIAT